MDLFNIVYAPGMGGNHVANLIALARKYELSIDKTVYDNTKMNVHQSLPRKNKNVKIKHFHIGGFIHSLSQQYTLPKSKNIFINLPTPGDLAYQRLIKWAPHYANEFVYSEHKQIYSIFLLNKITQQTWFRINPTKLFTDDISPLIKTLNTKFDLDIDNTEARIIHEKWIVKIQNYVKGEDSGILDS